MDILEMKNDKRRYPTVKVNNDACQGCKSCIKTCIYGVYSWDKEKNVSMAKYQEECVFCKQCEFNCPAGCIEIIMPTVSFYDPLFDPLGLNDEKGEVSK